MRRALVAVAAAVAMLPTASPASAQQAPPPPDLCLTVGLAELDRPTVDAIVLTVEDALATRPVLIPAPRVWPVVSATAEGGQVVRVAMPPGAPWPTLDLDDGTTISAMGIHGSDGARARTAVAELKALVARP